MSVVAKVNELDLVVYGQVQYDFSLQNGSTLIDGLTLEDVLVRCSDARALAVDHEVKTVSEVVRKRSQKVEDLGLAMAAIQYMTSCFLQDANQTDTYPKGGNLIDNINTGMISELYNHVKAYDLTCKTYDQGSKTTTTYNINTLLTYNPAQEVNGCTVGATDIALYWIQTIQSALQLALDQENNELKQASNTLQNFVDKRDDAYSLVSKVSDTLNKTMTTTVSAMGQ